MLVQHHHPIPLTSSPSSPPPPPEYSYSPHISPPSTVQIRPSVTKSQSNPPSPSKTVQPSFLIRRATVEDAPAIAHLGATVFSTTFGFSIPCNDLRAFLNEAYSVAAIEDDIRCPTKHIFVACKISKSRTGSLESSESSALSSASTDAESNDNSDDDASSDDDDEQDTIIGFTQLTEATIEPCLSHLHSTVELERLYVSTNHHSKGVGKRLARKVEHLARDLGYKAVWLGVWEGNFKAQMMYEGLGFRKVGDHEFKIGRCIQMDWIMCKKL